MKQNARLIHKTFTSYLPTTLPVSFYGLPDGNIYVIYSRFYEIDFDHSGLEFVFARHEEFVYDYTGQKLMLADSQEKRAPITEEVVDKPEPKIKIFKVSRSLKSYSEAQLVLNELADKMTKNTTESLEATF